MKRAQPQMNAVRIRVRWLWRGRKSCWNKYTWKEGEPHTSQTARTRVSFINNLHSSFHSHQQQLARHFNLNGQINTLHQLLTFANTWFMFSSIIAYKQAVPTRGLRITIFRRALLYMLFLPVQAFHSYSEGLAKSDCQTIPLRTEAWSPSKERIKWLLAYAGANINYFRS